MIVSALVGAQLGTKLVQRFLIEIDVDDIACQIVARSLPVLAKLSNFSAGHANVLGGLCGIVEKDSVACAAVGSRCGLIAVNR